MPKKATGLPIHHKYVEQIFSGEKDKEFRNYPVEGKVYFYETKGKLLGYAMKITSNHPLIEQWLEQFICELPDDVWDELESKGELEKEEQKLYADTNFFVNNLNEDEITGDFILRDMEYFIQNVKKECVAPKSFWNSFNGYPFDYELVPVYEGSGMFVGEAVVEYCLELGVPVKISDFETKVGGWIRTKDGDIKYIELDKIRLQKQGYDNQKYAMKLTNIIKYEKPIDKGAFVLWNKFQDYCKTCYLDTYKTIGYAFYKLGNEVMVTSAPQGRIYVVEKEL